MRTLCPILGVLFAVLLLVSCREQAKESTKAVESDGVLLRVGSVEVTQSDLNYELGENHGGRSDSTTREQALDALAGRAQFSQAALDSGLDADPVVRAEQARLLSSRLRETVLFPQLKEAASGEIPDERLRELYDQQQARFQSVEKRQVAVLWLNPGADPERLARYEEKLRQAREWFVKDTSLASQPEQGFSILSVDYSEHAPSRYKGGVVGWMQRGGGPDAWSQAIAEIAFAIDAPGEISAVITRPEGVFLVRYMALEPAVQRSFESVRGQLEKSERQRRRNEAQREFEQTIQAKYPVERLER
jgi:hypothetical protein